MKFISWNVNGFRACLDKGFADFFKEADADFFSIQESKMQPGQAEFDPEGYHQYWYSADKKGYSGTAVFAKKSFREKMNVLPVHFYIILSWTPIPSATAPLRLLQTCR